MQELLKKYQDILKLKDWDIEVIENSTLETHGCNNIVYNDYKCTVQIDANLCREQKERSLIHELLHLINRDSWDIANDSIENEYIGELYRRFEERSIEKYANIIYKLAGD